jgi:hypothetical protein
MQGILLPDLGGGKMEGADIYPQLNIEAVVVFATAAVAGVLISFTPLFYPFRLLFTTVHELGHVFAARFTGGEVKGFWVYFKKKNGALGVTVREGGDDRFVIPAGYLGTAIFSAGLILMSGLPYIAPYIVGILGGVLILLVLLHGRPFSTLFIGFVLGAGFIWVAWKADLIWSVFLLYLLAVLGIITARNDWKTMTHLARQDPSGTHDAAQMAKIKIMGRQWSAGCWAAVWSVITFLLLGVAFWFTWLRNLSG